MTKILSGYNEKWRHNRWRIIIRICILLGVEYFYQKRNRNLEESLDRLSERILENGSGHYETREDFKTGDSDIRAMEEALEQIGQGMKAVPMAEADVASRLQKVLQKPVVGRLKWRRWQICLQ